MGLLTAAIYQDGEVMNPQYQLLSIDIQREYNRIPFAEITLLDGDPVNQKFPITESAFFDVGKSIEICLKYDDPAEEESVFKGIIIRKGIQLLQNGCKLTVELSDVAVKMTAARKNAVFLDMTDADAMDKMIKGNAGVVKKMVEDTQIIQPQLIQYASTDWDFMLSRAEANGMLVSVSDGEVTVQKPVFTGEPALKIKFGKTEIYGFELEADSRFQQDVIQTTSWDVKTQEMVEAADAAKFDLPQDKINASGMREALGANVELLVNATSLQDKEAKAWADAKMMKDRLSALKGNLKIDGTGLAKVGMLILLEGVSTVFSGKLLVTGVRHEVSADGWYTYLQFGLSNNWFTAQYPVTETAASGLLPAVNGLQIGTVAAIAEDPGKEFRVQVKVPSLGKETNLIWARLASADAGSKRGMFFLPEVDDEVILGFLNDDPRQAIILGSMYSSAHEPPLTPEAENPQKGFVTIAGMKMLFDDKKKTVTLSTSDDQQIILDEEGKKITLTDKNKNTITLSEDGITISSEKDLILKSAGDVKVEATGKVGIKGSEVDVI